MEAPAVMKICNHAGRDGTDQNTPLAKTSVTRCPHCSRCCVSYMDLTSILTLCQALLLNCRCSLCAWISLVGLSSPHILKACELQSLTFSGIAGQAGFPLDGMHPHASAPRLAGHAGLMQQVRILAGTAKSEAVGARTTLSSFAAGLVL